MAFREEAGRSLKRSIADSEAASTRLCVRFGWGLLMPIFFDEFRSWVEYPNVRQITQLSRVLGGQPVSNGRVEQTTIDHKEALCPD